MDFFTLTSSLFPQNSDQELQQIENSADKALKSINSIYKEIMTPRNNEEDEILPDYLLLNNNIDNSHNYLVDNKNHEIDEDNLNKICSSCQKTISKCSKCNSTLYVKLPQHNKLVSTTVKNKINHSYKKLSNNTKDCNKIKKSVPKVTISEPFNITNVEEQNIRKKEKLLKLKEELNSSLEKELKVRIHSNPVPKHTYLPLYKYIVEKNEKRKRQRKEESKERLKKILKPFNFSSTSNQIKKSKSSSDLNSSPNVNFKATPLPKSILNTKISEKLKQKEEIRKILGAQRAEEILKQSTLPFSKKTISRSYSMINLNDLKKNDNLNRDKTKNSYLLSKRVYSKKCQQVMKEWNEKVLTVKPTTKEPEKMNKFEINKSLLIQSFPFYQMPVRMSKATLLRDNQIREDLLTKKEKEENLKRMEEIKIEKEKELKKMIYPRLKNFDLTINSSQDIQDKIKTYRASQMVRESEYQKELEEIMKRVSKQLLLIERQTKEKKSSISQGNKSDIQHSSIHQSTDSESEQSQSFSDLSE